MPATDTGTSPPGHTWRFPLRASVPFVSTPLQAAPLFTLLTVLPRNTRFCRALRLFQRLAVLFSRLLARRWESSVIDLFFLTFVFPPPFVPLLTRSLDSLVPLAFLAFVVSQGLRRTQNPPFPIYLAVILRRAGRFRRKVSG